MRKIIIAALVFALPLLAASCDNATRGRLLTRSRHQMPHL